MKNELELIREFEAFQLQVKQKVDLLNSNNIQRPNHQSSSMSTTTQVPSSITPNEPAQRYIDEDLSNNPNYKSILNFLLEPITTSISEGIQATSILEREQPPAEDENRERSGGEDDHSVKMKVKHQSPLSRYN